MIAAVIYFQVANSLTLAHSEGSFSFLNWETHPGAGRVRLMACAKQRKPIRFQLKLLKLHLTIEFVEYGCECRS